MQARVWNWAKATELPGNIVELIWPDGRTLQLSTSSDSDQSIVMLRAFPSNKRGDFSRITDMSMVFGFTPVGTYIQSLQTRMPNTLGHDSIITGDSYDPEMEDDKVILDMQKEEENTLQLMNFKPVEQELC